MREKMTSVEFAAKARDIADNYKTSYMLGPWGWPATDKMIARATTNGAYAQQNKAWLSYANAIKNKGFLFDCIGLIKGILWGWSGDLTRPYGGAGYELNGLKDWGADTVIGKCADVGTDFSAILAGEAVWMSGHIGVYVGGGVVVESTPKWKWGVQRSTCLNVSGRQLPGTAGGRRWTKHGKLPWVDYSASQSAVQAVDKLARLGVVNSPGCWKDAVDAGKVKYLDALLAKAAANITKAGPRLSTAEDGIGALKAAGVIDTPDYWLARYRDLPNLGDLLCALGGAVK